MNRQILILTIASVLAGCGGDETSCTTNGDCFRGESCVDSICQAVEDNNGNGAINNANGATNNANATVNNVNATPNVTPNNTPNGSTNGTPNGSTNGTDNNDARVCTVDPFTAMCPADDNDDFSDYITMDGGRGCLGGGDDFEGGEVEWSAVMCPLEAEDNFHTNLLPCDNVVFVVEVTVKPRQPCSPDDWNFNMRLQGNDCVETNDKMRCETLQDGSKRATGFLEPSNSVTSPYLEISPIAENLQFDYDVKLVTRL